MTKSEIQDAANIETIRKLRANGHQFEFTTYRTHKGTIAVGLRLWHRNDTKRLVETGRYLAAFHGQSFANGYIKQMETA